MKIQVAPSLLSANFANLEQDIKKVELAGVDLLHLDVMDGHFVPNITFGPVVVKDIRKITKLPLDAHLMITDPLKYVDAFIDAGSDMVTVHIETVNEQDIKVLRAKFDQKKIKLGVSLNPPTPLEKITPFLKYFDFVLVMSVNPGFGGQEFIVSAVEKIKELRKIYDKDISVDGGINDKTAKLVVDAGANILVAGSYVFKAKDCQETIRSLKCANQK